MNGKILKEAITFDDVLLVPARSEVLPHQVSLKTRLTKKITLNVPILSAAMDTVTESDLAIALARQGGIGFIHKNMSIEEQAAEVDRVKRSESGMITNPITLNQESTVMQAEEIMRRYKISGLPVIEEDGKLIGIITNRDIKYRKDMNQLVGEIMTKEKLITAPVGTTLDEAKEVLLANRIEKLPITDEEGYLKGLITIKDIDNIIQYPNACKDEKGTLRCGAAVGIGPDTLDRVKALVEAGANAVKVGIGPGSICTTRVVAGVGVPQLTAVNDVYEYCKNQGIGVIADGGIKLSGDIVKALAAGADCVMLGGLLAGTKEAPGEEILLEGKKFKSYVGMGSIAAMKRGSKDRYFQTETDAQKLVPEGIEGRIAYKGAVKDVVFQLCGGIRAGMGYCGTPTIERLQVEGRFMKITGAGLLESHPHDITITKEAPNYSK